MQDAKIFGCLPPSQEEGALCHCGIFPTLIQEKLLFVNNIIEHLVAIMLLQSSLTAHALLKDGRCIHTTNASLYVMLLETSISSALSFFYTGFLLNIKNNTPYFLWTDLLIDAEHLHSDDAHRSNIWLSAAAESLSKWAHHTVCTSQQGQDATQGDAQNDLSQKREAIFSTLVKGLTLLMTRILSTHFKSQP